MILAIAATAIITAILTFLASQWLFKEVLMETCRQQALDEYRKTALDEYRKTMHKLKP